jgi:putative membrane protein
MALEAWLSFFHITSFLAWIVFASSQAALCRSDWMNPAAVRRLVRLDRILWFATAAVVLSGLARVWWGAKGVQWYAVNPLLYTKIVLFAIVASLQISPSRHYRRWLARIDDQILPSEDQVRSARRKIMIATHLMAVIPLPAVFLARGFGG